MNKKIELSTLLGISFALVLIATAIASGDNARFLSFFDVPSFLIVIGGTFFVTCASYTISDTVKAMGTSGQTLFYTAANKSKIAATCVRLADLAKKEGILALQKNEELYGEMDNFFKKYLGLIIDGLNIKDAEKLIISEISSIRDRHKKAAEILRKASEIAPAMGLVGTLIGLVQMLGNLSDPSKIGPAMAIALLTTLYGALTSYVILVPLVSKLEKNSKEEVEILKIYGDAVLAVANQESAFKLEMKMNANLPPEDRIKIYS